MSTDTQPTIRFDHKIISDLIQKETKVLDLGCGDGTLLYLLKKNKSCKVTGIEIDEKEIYKCIEKGISVCHDDIDSSLTDFSDKRFDYVILNESLQQVLNPEKVILEMKRCRRKFV